MKQNGTNRQSLSRRSRIYSLPRLDAWQTQIEQSSMRLREELCLSDMIALDHADAIKQIPRCIIWPLESLPIELEHLVHFRTKGIGCGAITVPHKDGSVDIIINDAHTPKAIRTYLMEEVFHIRLGHRPDIVRTYPEAGVYRTYSHAKEDEAYGCGIAALVPYGGLEAMLADGEHLSRIAEHFVVPISVVQYRVEATKLGELANATTSQRSLISGTTNF